VGLAAHTGQVDVRITAKADSEAEADQMIAEVEQKLHSKIGRFVFGIDQEKIEDVLVQLLLKHKVSIAISETGINTPISEAINAVNGGHQVLTNTQSYATPENLRVALASPSETPIRELAEQAAKTLSQNANTLASIAAISRPEMDEYHADSESGTAIAVYLDGKMRSRVFGFGGQSDIAPVWVTTWALSMLWQMLQEKFE
jgi:nicotinamide-nucleotide amidase